MEDLAPIEGPTGKPSISTLFRNALEASPQAHPSDAVSVVIDAIDPSDYPHYLRELLLARAASEISTLRGRNTPGIRPGVSTKQSLIRDEYWPRFLRQRISTPSGMKFLAEATAEDLRFVASVRHAQASELAERAEEFGALADLMDKAGARYLEQLDKSTAARALRSAA